MPDFPMAFSMSKVLASYKPGDAEKLGMDAEGLRASHPRLIYAGNLEKQIIMKTYCFKECLVRLFFIVLNLFSRKYAVSQKTVVVLEDQGPGRVYSAFAGCQGILGVKYP